MVSESKVLVYWHSSRLGGLVASPDFSKAEGRTFVTHSDYMALQAEHEALKAKAAEDAEDAELFRWFFNRRGNLDRWRFVITENMRESDTARRTQEKQA